MSKRKRSTCPDDDGRSWVHIMVCILGYVLLKRMGSVWVRICDPNKLTQNLSQKKLSGCWRRFRHGRSKPHSLPALLYLDKGMITIESIEDISSLYAPRGRHRRILVPDIGFFSDCGYPHCLPIDLLLPHSCSKEQQAVRNTDRVWWSNSMYSAAVSVCLYWVILSLN